MGGSKVNQHLSTTMHTEPTAQVNMTEFAGSIKSSIKMSKDMKYIQQKVIPTDKTLKCDQQNSTFLHSTSIKKRMSSVNKENGSRLPGAPATSTIGVSEFRLKPQT